MRRGSRGVGRVLRRLITTIMLVTALFAAGLVWFAWDAGRELKDDGRQTDAIVVWTGGSARVEEGVRLLVEDRAERLFISGVHPDVRLEELLALSNPVPPGTAERITLGRLAADTEGNAAETAEWARAADVETIRLVTSNYHMARSTLELARAMPEAEILRWPVRPEAVRIDDWWRWPGTAALVVREYVKYLLALARSFTPPKPEPSSP